MDAILARAGFSPCACTLTEGMTLNRLIGPRSEHAMADWIRSTALGDILREDFSALVDEALYRSLDRLHPQRETIERDKRPDLKQVVVGLVLDREVFPKAHEVFDGNTQDRTSLDQMLDALEKRRGKRPGTTVIVDRGMADEENLEQIRGRGLH